MKFFKMISLVTALLLSASPAGAKDKNRPLAVGQVKPTAEQAAAVALPSRVFVVPNFHPASCGWLTNWSAERDYCANSYLNHLDRVRDDANYEFVLSECNNMIAIRNFEPRRFAELKERIKEGRVELVNAFFLESTTSLSGGEALAKMGIEGLRWQQQVMGVRPRFLWAIDLCDTHEQMPQLAAALGLEALIYTRCNPTDKTVFWSESPDGSRILTLVPGHYSEDLGGAYQAKGPLTEAQLGDAAKFIAAKVPGTPTGAPVLILGGSGDYSLAPANPGNPTDFLRQWKAFRPGCDIRFTTLSKFFDALLPGVRSGDIKLSTTRGGTGYTFDSFWIENPRVKSWYRRDEHALQAAETLATIASLKAGYEYPVERFYDAWLQMLLNMDRNTLWGSAGGMVFEHQTSWDARDRLAWVEAMSAAALEAGARKLLGDGAGVGLFNPANWSRIDPLRLKLPAGTRIAGAMSEAAEDGTTLCRVEVPATGLVGVRLESEPPAAPGPIDLPRTIETAFYTARLDPATGAIVSLKTKPSGREMLGGPANVLVAERREGPGDPGDFMEPRPKRPRLASSNDFKPAITVTEGPLTVTVSVRSEFIGRAPSRRLMRFYKSHPRIEFETELNDIPNLTVVVAEFPLAAAPTEIRRAIPFGFAHGAWARPNPELHSSVKGINPAVRWSDYSMPGGGGLAILDRGLTGREINDKTPIIYLYNATDKYYGYANSWLSGKGVHKLEYSLIAHDADWNSARIPQLAWEYNCPVALAQGCAAAKPESFVRTSGNVLVEVVRRDGADIEMRLEECLGLSGTAEVTLNLPHEQAVMTDLVGGNAQKLDGGPTYTFPLRPQQIVTLRFRTASPVAKVTPLTEWNDLVPASKRAALHEHMKDRKGHPPKGE
jgi:alpha-mannosidase